MKLYLLCTISMLMGPSLCFSFGGHLRVRGGGGSRSPSFSFSFNTHMVISHQISNGVNVVNVVVIHEKSGKTALYVGDRKCLPPLFEVHHLCLKMVFTTWRGWLPWYPSQTWPTRVHYYPRRSGCFFLSVAVWPSPVLKWRPVCVGPFVYAVAV